jgi:hypothetical protein
MHSSTYSTNRFIDFIEILYGRLKLVVVGQLRSSTLLTLNKIPAYMKQFFIHSSTALQPFVGPWPLLQFRNLFYTVGRTTWTGDQSVARPLPTHRTTQIQNKRTHRHPCLEWDSNPRSQRPSDRRQFMP